MFLSFPTTPIFFFCVMSSITFSHIGIGASTTTQKHFFMCFGIFEYMRSVGISSFF
jgi:hypothetical protein